MLSSGLWRVSTPTAAAGLNNGPSVLLWIERLHLQSCPCLSTPAFLPYLIIGISMLYVPVKAYTLRRVWPNTNTIYSST
ncbi:hypothetical protein DTO271D3_1051 [Paecilomyces variotii]|nr:hypothetical protein DTO271D3_1051 [Paecilomyces variotii]KAJ9347754.1 hypothetical protein DTO027B9_8905 [Paecilomyces variotii]